MPAVGRLKKRPDFLKVAAAHAKWVMPGLILQARRRGSQDQPVAGGAGRRRATTAEDVRVGFTVSRKVGEATERNRARRRLRAAAAEVLPRYGRPGYDYVVIGRRATLERSYDRLVDDLRTALARAAAQEQETGKRKGGREPDGKESA
ncbi:MAG TPA: ribonuclease P protein component [Kiloniellales bacterium]